MSFTNIHLANAADASHYDINHNLILDNPADPNTWSFTGDNSFKIGNINTNPATIDVGTNNTDPTDTALFLNLPISGSLRIGDVQLGGNDFGPIAIDGINAHHLFVKISTK